MAEFRSHNSPRFRSIDIQHWLGYAAPSFPASKFIPAILGTVVFVYGGLVFIRGAGSELADHKPGMMTLISLVRFCPGIQGGVEWNGAAFSPDTNSLYVAAVDWCAKVQVKRDIEVPASGWLWLGNENPFADIFDPARDSKVSDAPF